MTAKELRYQRNRHRQQFTRYEQALIKFSQAESLSKKERELAEKMLVCTRAILQCWREQTEYLAKVIEPEKAKGIFNSKLERKEGESENANTSQKDDSTLS